MELRNMINRVFGGVRSPVTVTSYKMLNDFTPTFTAYNGDLYDSDIVRSCVHAIASNAGKLKAKHIRTVAGAIVPTNSKIERLLSVRPNRYMNAYDFIYKLVSQLYSHNNAFAYIHYERGEIEGIYPIGFSSLEMVEYLGELYCKFTFGTGFQMTVPYSDLIHLRRHYNRNDIYGDDPRKPFKPTLDLISTINQGLANAIKSSARLRGLLKTTATMRPEDLKAYRDQFVADYMGISNDGGVGALDAKADFVAANDKFSPLMADADQMAFVRNSAYLHFGVNDKIILATYDENEWNAFYESVLEPIAIQLSLEFTAKLFTGREQGHGNEIIFEANRLQYASVKTKIELVKQLAPLGLLKINEGREIFNIAPVEGGEKRIVSLNYVDADKANQYQVGEKEEVDDDENGNQAGSAGDGTAD